MSRGSLFIYVHVTNKGVSMASLFIYVHVTNKGVSIWVLCCLVRGVACLVSKPLLVYCLYCYGYTLHGLDSLMFRNILKILHSKIF